MITHHHPLDSQPPAIVDDLRTVLDAHLPTFVLIDALIGEPIPVSAAAPATELQSLREKAWQRAVQAIPLDASCRLPAHLHPYLVILDGTDDPLLELTWDMAESERSEAVAEGLDGEGIAPHRIGGWLQSSMPPAMLAAHIASMLRVRTEAPTACRYLRLVDRRVLALLCFVVGEKRIAAQLGELQRWCFLGLRGDLAILEGSNTNALPITLSVSEWKTMQQGAAFNRALAHWAGEAELIGNGKTLTRSPGLYSSLARALDAADDLASEHPLCFPTLGDRTVWAALSMLRPSLSKNSAVRNLLADSQEPFRHLCRQAEILLDSE